MKYDARAGQSLVNYGVSIGHIPTRIAVMKDPGDFLPSGPAAHRAATAGEIADISGRIERGLSRGAVAVGFGFAYAGSGARRTARRLQGRGEGRRLRTSTCAAAIRWRARTK